MMTRIINVLSICQGGCPRDRWGQSLDLAGSWGKSFAPVLFPNDIVKNSNRFGCCFCCVKDSWFRGLGYNSLFLWPPYFGHGLLYACSWAAHGPLMGCSMLALCSLYTQGHELGMSWACVGHGFRYVSVLHRIEHFITYIQKVDNIFGVFKKNLYLCKMIYY